MCRCHRPLLDYCGNSLRHSLFLCVSFTKRAQKTPQTITSTRLFSSLRDAPTALRLFKDSLHITLITEMISTAAATPKASPRTPPPPHQRSAELTFGADVRGREDGCAANTCSVISARGSHGPGRYPCSPNEERRAGCRVPSPPLPPRSRLRADSGS